MHPPRKLLILLVFLTIFSGLSQALSAPRTTVLPFNGQDVTVIDESPERYKDTQVKKDGRTHTLRVYGARYLTFMASMAATELVYCSRTNVPFIADNEETPTCYDELIQMMLDPGMSLGVIGMTATSLELYRRGDKTLQRFLKKMLAPKKVKAAIQIGQSALQSLSMGVGMMVQTTISSTWNSPYSRECMIQMKNAVAANVSGEKLNHHSTEAQVEKRQEEVSSGIDQGFLDDKCIKAWEFFNNAENGTTSEMYITILSLGVSTVLSATIMSSIRFVGLAVSRAGPIGMAVTGSYMAANALIEYLDRIFEPIIRAFYHRIRARYLLGWSFEQLEEDLNHFREKSQFMDIYTRNMGCKELKYSPNEMGTLVPDWEDGEQACKKWRVKSVKDFRLYNFLVDYKKNIDYHREAQLNRFIEAHNRWQQKVSHLIASIGSYQTIVRKIYEIRETFKTTNDKDLDTSYNMYEPITWIRDPKALAKFDIRTKNQDTLLNAPQIQKLYEVINKVREKIQDHPHDFNQDLRRIMEDFHIGLKMADHQMIHVSLWRLKNYLSVKHQTGRKYSTTINTGVNFSDEEIEEMRELFYHPITAMNPRTRYAFFEFEAAQVNYLDVFDFDLDAVLDEKEPTKPVRKGVTFEDDPLSTVVSLSQDERDEPKTIPSKIINHLACNSSSEIELLYNEGWASQVAYGQILKYPNSMDCRYKSKYSFLDRYYYPDYDYVVAPNSNFSQMETDPVLHRIYSYGGKEYIGLLDILIDPKVPLRWQNYEEYQQHWKQVIKPEILRFLLTLRKEYFAMMDNFYTPSGGCENESSLARRQLCERRRRKSFSVNKPITDKEFDERLESWSVSNGSNSSYYAYAVGALESMSDEVRTYQYIVSQIMEDPKKANVFFNGLYEPLEQIREALQLPTNIIDFDPQSMGPEELQEKMEADPAFELLGEESIQQFGDAYSALATKLMMAKLIMLKNGDKVQYEQGKGVSLEDGRTILVFKMLENLEQSLHFYINVMLEKYIGGDKIIYIPPDS